MISFQDILPPMSSSSTVFTDQIIHGPRIPSQQQILLYSAEQWEEFIHEWAHFCLKKLYTKVQRFSGPGDRGIDIAGFTDKNMLQGVWDNYQCKHYDQALSPTNIWPELGKVLWYSFNKEYKTPRKYFFVAPRGVGTKLNGYLANADRFKNELLDNWDKHVRHKITEKQEIPLEGKFLSYVEAFDFSIFESKTAIEIIEDHRQSPCHAARFGGGLPVRPDVPTPPPQISQTESRYVEQLLIAYTDHTKSTIPDSNELKKFTKLNNHFRRQREAFYHAESLRVFARDTVPYGTFESLQDDIYTGIIDTHDADHPDGFVRVCKVTESARNLQITSNALVTSIKPKDRDGICHQLANDDRLQWTQS